MSAKTDGHGKHDAHGGHDSHGHGDSHGGGAGDWAKLIWAITGSVALIFVLLHLTGLDNNRHQFVLKSAPAIQTTRKTSPLKTLFTKLQCNEHEWRCDDIYPQDPRKNDDDQQWLTIDPQEHADLLFSKKRGDVIEECLRGDTWVIFDDDSCTGPDVHGFRFLSATSEKQRFGWKFVPWSRDADMQPEFH